MASKAAAFHAWASGFGIPAYPAASVPKGARMPYLTYSFGSAAWGEEPFAAEADLWYPAESGEAVPNAKAEEMGAALGGCGSVLRCDGGAMRVLRGSPFWQALRDEDPAVMRRFINLEIEFYTND